MGVSWSHLIFEILQGSQDLDSVEQDFQCLSDWDEPRLPVPAEHYCDLRLCKSNETVHIAEKGILFWRGFPSMTVT